MSYTIEQLNDYWHKCYSEPLDEARVDSILMDAIGKAMRIVALEDEVTNLKERLSCTEREVRVRDDLAKVVANYF